MRQTVIWLVINSALISPAVAHHGAWPIDSFSDGIAHPLGGLDHVIGMTTVGMWSVLRGGRATFVWPLTFVAGMLGGFAATRAGLQISFVEPVVTFSIAVFALLVAFRVNAHCMLGALIVALFAFFHGHAHGTEAAGAGLVAHAVGFTFSTSGLLVTGMVVGLGVRCLIERIAGRLTDGFGGAGRSVSEGTPI